MKIQIVPVLLLLCSSLTAQIKVQPLKKFSDYKVKQTYEREINFLDRTNNDYFDNIRTGRRYKYKLININRFVFSESAAEEKNENYNVEVPDIFKSFTLPGYITSSEMNFTANQYKTVTKAFVAPKLPSGTASKDTCNCQSLKMLFKADTAEKTYKALAMENSIFQAQQKTFATYKTIGKELKTLKANTSKIFAGIDSAKRRLLGNTLNLTLSTTDANNTLTQTYLDVKENAVAAAAEIDSLTARLSKTFNAAIEKGEACYDDMLRALRCTGDSCRNSGYATRSGALNDLRKCIQTLTDSLQFFKDYAKNISETVEKMDEVISGGKIDDIQKDYNLLVPANFELELETFKAEKDVHEISFVADAGEPIADGLRSKRKIAVRALPLGGLKLDFSTGVFFNHGSNRFLGPEYYYEPVGDTAKIIRESERNKKTMFSLGALMHVSTRLNSDIRPALSFGVSVTSNLDSYNFHLGLSAILGRFGKPDRLIITAGVTWKESDLLNSRFVLDQQRNDYPDEIPTSKTFPITGSFVSLTYNFSSFK